MQIPNIAWCCIMLKQYNKALEYLDKSDTNYEFYDMIYGTYLVIYRGLKDETKFFEYKEIIEKASSDKSCSLYNRAVLNKLLGKKEESIELLGKLLQHPMFLFTFMQYDEFWEEFHEEERFKELVTAKYKGTGNQTIKIESDTKEYVELNIKDFLYAEAQDNYTLVVYKDKNGVSNKILRSTLANIEKQLSFQEIKRCHRSYIFNAFSEFSFQKSDNKAVLKHPDLEVSILLHAQKKKK